MRLSQIARKVGATQSTIIELLESKGFEAPKGGNAKLSEEQVTIIYKEYDITVFTDPEIIKEETVENEREEVVEPVAEEPTIVESDVIETPSEEDVVTKEPDTIELEEPEEEVEVIRAKTIKLDGIKVLGKIDLPEPKEKRVEEAKEEPEKKREPRRPRGKRRDNRQRRKPLTFEEKQAREERKIQRQKEERERRLKEKKKKYFEKNIKPKQKEAAEVVRKKKKKKEAEAQKPPKNNRTQLTTKNPFIRFWQWLNDPYA